MYKDLKNVLKKKFDNSVTLKILGLKDYEAFGSFLFKKSTVFMKNVIESAGLEQLSDNNIKQGDLLTTHEQFAITVLNHHTGVLDKKVLPKGSLLTLISFIVTKDHEQKNIPNISMWYTVFYDEKIYYMESVEFLTYVGAKYIKLHDLSS